MFATWKGIFHTWIYYIVCMNFFYNVGFVAIFNLAKTLNRTFFTLFRFDFIIAQMNKIDQIV